MKIKKVTHYVSEEGFEFTFEPVEDTVTITKTENGYEARYLVQDDNAMSPDEDEDEGLFLVGYHRDFTVNREKRKYDKETGRSTVIDNGISKELAQHIANGGKYEDGSIDSEAKDYIKKYHIFGLEAYIHSGVVLALSNEGNFCDRQWDVSQLGLVFVSKEEWKTRVKAREAAIGLIETWNQYLSGDTYGIVKETYDKDKEQLDHDACWGFGGYDYALESLKTEI